MARIRALLLRAIGLPAYLASYDLSKRYFLNSLGDESSSSSKLLAWVAGTIADFVLVSMCFGLSENTKATGQR